jgi:two-component system cell cycle sensor histidine kinase/response regulator CckA
MTSAALSSRFSTAHADENCSDLNQVIARAERSIGEVAGRQVSVVFALSSGATRVAVPLAELERIVLGLCSAARSLLSPGGRMVIETRGMNDALVTPMSGVVSSTPARARILIRAEQLGNEPPRTPQRDALAAQPTIGYSDLEDLLERLGGRLEFVPLSEHDIAYVAHLPFAVGGESSGRMAIAVPQEAGVILLVEDEPQVQAVTTRILRAFGYAVVAAHNERTALAQAEQYGAAISLIVSDLVLPGVSGKELVRRLHRPCELARVLYISGYSPEHVGALPEGECFLRKPFTAQELLAIVRELMPEAAF